MHSCLIGTLDSHITTGNRAKGIYNRKDNKVTEVAFTTFIGIKEIMNVK